MLERVPDWKLFLQVSIVDEALEAIPAHGRTGRLLGGGKWLGKSEALVGLRPLARPYPEEIEDFE